MSTFDGLIREFPAIAIDNFRARPGVSVYLLSHVHSDHLTGLANKTWDSPIYCSQITAKWLPLLATRSKQNAFETGQATSLERKYAHLAPYLRPLATDQPYYLHLANGRKVRCTLIPAHHCPGAVMFMLQDDRSCILYTGDTRNEAIDLATLKTMPLFSPGAPKIDCLYLDTTCCHPALREFPQREHAISDLVTFITHRPRLAHYYFDAWTFGYEQVWVALSRAFGTKVHVSSYLYELYEAIDGLIDPPILPHITTDGTKARFHSCRLGPSCSYGGSGGEHAMTRELIRIQPNVAWFSMPQQRNGEHGAQNLTRQGTVVGRNANYTIKERLPPSISKRDDLFYYFNYGLHASLSELEELVRVIQPRALFPCVLHKDSGLQTYANANSKVVALLTHAMPDVGTIDRTAMTNSQRIEADYGIAGDFQEYYQRNGYNALDPKADTHVTGPSKPSTSDRGICDDMVLSPRSIRLQKKIDRLKRQLRNTASLEGKEDATLEDEDSSVEDGPLSLDLNEIERKRRWWLAMDRKKDVSLEECLEDTTTESIHGRSDLQGLGKTLRDNSATQDDVSKEEPWFDKSTLELNVSMILPESTLQRPCTGQLQSDRHDPMATRALLSSSYDTISDYSISHTEAPSTESESCTHLATTKKQASWKLEVEPVLESDSTPQSESRPWPDHELGLQLPQAVNESDSKSTKNYEQDGSRPIERRRSMAIQPSLDLVSAPDAELLLSLPERPRTPPRTPPPRPSDKLVSLGKSPTTVRHIDMTPLPIVRPPENNIYAQLAWSPPFRPVGSARLKRSLTDQNEARSRSRNGDTFNPPPPRRTQSVAATRNPSEVIIIDSSCSSSSSSSEDEVDSGHGYGVKKSKDHKEVESGKASSLPKKRPRHPTRETMFSSPQPLSSCVLLDTSGASRAGSRQLEDQTLPRVLEVTASASRCEEQPQEQPDSQDTFWFQDFSPI
ncbi:hypothetical protein BGZ94_002905 [Podila epigama]|nr:hypothetical protein BGZ94_002905 [Podila epigama]